MRRFEAAIKEGQNLVEEGNQAPVNGAPSDRAATAEVFLLRPSLSPPGAVAWRLGTRARDQGGRREDPPTWGAR